jgi:hypothetical protein
MNDNVLSALAGAIGGLLIGGLLADRATEIGALLVAWGTLGGFVAGGYAAIRHHSVTRWTAVGGLAGIAFGVALVLVDALFF